MVMESILIIVILSHIVQNVQIRRNLIVVFLETQVSMARKCLNKSIHFLHHGIEPAHKVSLYKVC